MQEQMLAENNVNSNVQTIEHKYYEVGRELLSKPNLLGDIVELESSAKILIFCNTPSDTDFVEVMLKKRGVNAQKLIGNVPQPKLDRCIEQVQNGEVNVIVLTDIAARNLDFSLFSLAINYSVPADADSYHERCGRSKNTSGIQRIITLVSALEITNFHYLKKSLAMEPTKTEPPSADELLASRFASLKKYALESSAKVDEKYKKLASIALSDNEKESVVALLLENTFVVIPSLKASASKASEFDEEDDYEIRQDRSSGRTRDNSGRSSRNNQRENSRSDGRNRSNRNSRRLDDRNGSYEGLPRIDEHGELVDNANYDSEVYDSGEEAPQRERYGRERSDSRRQEGNTYKRDARIYLGVGSENNFTKDSIVKILKDNTQIPNGEPKLLSIRSHYSFFDIDEESCQDVINALSNAQNTDGAPYNPIKAISLNSGTGPRRNNSNSYNEEQSFNESSELSDTENEILSEQPANEEF